MDNGKKEINSRGYWTYYKKDNQKVKELFLKKDYEKTKVTGLGNFDGLFCFLIEVDFPSIFDFRPDCRQRVMIPLSIFSFHLQFESNMRIGLS